MLLLSLALDTLVFIATAYFIVQQKSMLNQDALDTLSEAPITGFLGAFAACIAYLLPLAVLLSPSGYDKAAELTIAAFSVLTALTASFTFLYAYVKKQVLYHDCLVITTPFGTLQKVYWQDITEVTVPFMRKKVVLKANAKSYSIVGGDPKCFKPFIETVKSCLPGEKGGYVLSELLARL